MEEYIVVSTLRNGESWWAVVCMWWWLNYHSCWNPRARGTSEEWFNLIILLAVVQPDRVELLPKQPMLTVVIVISHEFLSFVMWDESSYVELYTVRALYIYGRTKIQMKGMIRQRKRYHIPWLQFILGLSMLHTSHTAQLTSSSSSSSTLWENNTRLFSPERKRKREREIKNITTQLDFVRSSKYDVVVCTYLERNKSLSSIQIICRFNLFRCFYNTALQWFLLYYGCRGKLVGSVGHVQTAYAVLPSHNRHGPLFERFFPIVWP